MRSVTMGGCKVIASDVLKSYWHVAAERQRIYHGRLQGTPGPWTTDPILSGYRFTNAYRAADRVSQDLIAMQYAGPQGLEDVVLRTLLYRFFNKPTTWLAIEESVGMLSLDTFDLVAIDRKLNALLAAGERVYSPAYIIPPPPFGATRKHLNHLRLAQHIVTSDAMSRIASARRLQDVYECLISFPSLGPFLAFQLTIDLNYSTAVNFDENDFVVAGPGARSGIAKCFPQLSDVSPEYVIGWMQENQQNEFERYELDFQDLFGRPLALVDCQNLFCETDKYARVAHPEVAGIGNRAKIKQRFAPRAGSTRPFFPPKWNLNPVGWKAPVSGSSTQDANYHQQSLDLSGSERVAVE